MAMYSAVPDNCASEGGTWLCRRWGQWKCMICGECSVMKGGSSDGGLSNKEKKSGGEKEGNSGYVSVESRRKGKKENKSEREKEMSNGRW